ncbi:vacuolar protein-sorting-associated protein 37 homolog 2 isoform X2 [Cryptomeria japonica]|uniref:vacuolar protein-sorting-associated protein 37 homolog 2 isoform X2 n=1 Tax=Cryptomeria japonica TaxID=3369 RepID=UPI0027DA27A1|nr:vacuolar protein-sorting-associated protein 37 homolog 2 isoform X2 [Cryptomeria japonica]
MFQPFWGAQHPTEPTFPNISAQSWYQPSVLSSLTETCYPPLPNNLIPAGPNSFQRAGDCTNTCPAPRPQSPFYSDLSPETRGLVFSLLAEKSEDELRTYLTDKDAYNKILHSIGEVKHMGHLRDDLCMKTTQLARKNIENATQIAELKNQGFRDFWKLHELHCSSKGGREFWSDVISVSYKFMNKIHCVFYSIFHMLNSPSFIKFNTTWSSKKSISFM